MAAFAIWFSGMTLSLRAVFEIVCLKAPAVKKCIAIAFMLLTSWIGAILYTFYAKEKMQAWLS